MKSLVIFGFLIAAALAAPSPVVKPRRDMDFDRYWSYEEIVDWMTELAAANPDITQLIQMGRTHEDRDIVGMIVTSAEHLAQETLPVIFVTGGVIARDWITVMAAVDLIHELVDHHDDFRHLVDDVEWFILPCANPDGYEFSREAPENRAWTKNRAETREPDCIGVNVDRNFGFNFGLPLASTNSNPCSPNFRGEEADSEEETKTIQFAIDITRRIQRGYITLKAADVRGHSTIAFPFSSNNELFMPNWSEKIVVANIMADTAFQQTGIRFTAGSEANVNMLKSGTSADYASGVDLVPLAYTIYAPRGGPNGWDVPESQINTMVDQIFFAIEALGEYVADMPLPENENQQ